MKRLDEILRSAEKKKDTAWAMAVYGALLTELRRMHSEGKHAPGLTPESVELADDFSASGQLCIHTDADNHVDRDLYYLSPEALNKQYDARSDIFAATAIFYLLLSGKLPWEGCCDCVSSLRQKLIMLKLQRKPATLDLQTIPEALRLIVQKGLAIDSSERYDTAESAIKDLEAIDPAHVVSAAEHESPSAAEPDSPHQDNKRQPMTSYSGRGEEKCTFVFRKGSGGGFKDIAGMNELKHILSDDVLFVIRNQEVAQRYRINPLNGILLYGPPGCGKTYLAEKFAEEAGTNYILVKASDLGSTYIHGTQERIAQLFKQAKKYAPAVICLDEFDAMAPDRSSRAGEQTANEVNEFLSCLNNCSHDGIFVIAMTNRPDKVDPAVLRSGRFDKMIYVPLPDKDTRKQIFAIHMQGRPYDANTLDMDKLSELSDGYVSSDISLIVNNAARKAAHANQLITEELLEESIHHTEPSVKADMVKYYNQIHLQMEHGRDARPVIGFC